MAVSIKSEKQRSIAVAETTRDMQAINSSMVRMPFRFRLFEIIGIDIIDRIEEQNDMLLPSYYYSESKIF